MTLDDHRGYEYDFTLELCNAIEKFTQKRTNKDSSTFFYKSSDLTYAVERAMFFRYINDESFFSLFQRYKNKTLPQKIIVHDNIESDLLTELIHIPQENIYIKKDDLLVTTKKKMREILRIFLICSGVRSIVKVVRILKYKLTFRGLKSTILFSAESIKFIRFLEPIVTQLTGEYAFIVQDRKVCAYLKSKKIPHVRAWSRLYFLERWAKKKDMLYKFTLTDKYDLFGDAIQIIRPKTMVLVEGNAPQDEVINRICKKVGVKSVTIQQGWSPVVHNGFRNMSYSKMLTWGDGFSELLQPYNPNEQFVSTGNHVISLKELKVNKIDNIVLFFQVKTRIISNAVWLKFIELAKKIKIKFKEKEIIVREHPVYPFSTDEREYLTEVGIKFMSAPEYSLEQVLDIADLTISIYSSTILESIGAGVLPIIYNITSFPHYNPDISRLRAGIEVKNDNEIISVIEKLDKNRNKLLELKEHVKQFQRRFFRAGREKAIANIISQLF